MGRKGTIKTRAMPRALATARIERAPGGLQARAVERVDFREGNGLETSLTGCDKRGRVCVWLMMIEAVMPKSPSLLSLSILLLDLLSCATGLLFGWEQGGDSA